MKTRPGEKIKMLTVDELLGVPEGESAIQIEVCKIYVLKTIRLKSLKILRCRN